MNTELFDYIKALSKTEFFYVSLTDLILSSVIIICGIISLTTGASSLLYAIMFACASTILGLNSYKCFKRGSKNGIVFVVLSAGFVFVTAICIYGVFVG
ncbi:MAG: hypothetical protein K6F28_10745 [Lachnospiraceae bacterium]|nr:hypothetical protein [Lachnospiraceae bacterium]